MSGKQRAPSPSGSTAGSTAGGRVQPTIVGTTDNTKDDFKIEYFHGDRTKLRFFLTQLRALFALRSNKYPTGKAQVLLAGMHLRDAAFDWFEPTLTDYLESAHPEESTIEMFKKYTNFEEGIKKVFGIANEERAAERIIHQLKQKGSAAQYYSQFQAVASKLDWEDSALKAAYYAGLKDIVKDQMEEVPSEYQEMIDKSIRIDNRLYERRMEKGAWGGTYRFSGGGTPARHHGGRTPAQNYGDPMDLDFMAPGRPSRPNARGRGGRRDQGEQERRKKGNLCYNCGKPGHRARDCKTQARTLQMMTKGKPGLMAQKADTIRKGNRATQRTLERAKAQKRREPEEASSDGKGHPVKAKIQHAAMSWTACFDDECPIHLPDKEGAGWMPRKHEKSPKPTWWEDPESTTEDDEAQEAPKMAARPKKEATKPKSYRGEVKEVGEYEVLYQHPACMIIHTMHWAYHMTSNGTRMPVYCAEGDELVSQAVVLRRCTDTTCGQFRSLHTHDVLGGTWCKLPPPTEDNEQHLDMMIPEKGTRSQSDVQLQPGLLDPEDITDGCTVRIPDLVDPEQDPESTLPDPEPDRKYVIVSLNKGDLTVITNYWTRISCQDKDCEIEAQHSHAVFTPGREPKEYLRMIKIQFCSWENCWYAPRIHAHQYETSYDLLDFKVPEEIAERVWGIAQPDMRHLDMLVRNLGVIDTVIHEVGNDEYIAEYFECNNTECELFWTNHKHTFNIDPKRPWIPIGPEQAKRMIEGGGVCDTQECEWRQHLHLHLPKNDEEAAQ
jgi:Retrotransposon gag protein/Zinc knuckle